MARVATQTAQQQVQLTAALQNLAAAQAATTPTTEPADSRPRAATTPFDTGGKILKPPEAFSPATLEEEVSQWSDWAFTFKNLLAFMDQDFLTDFEEAESQEAEIAMGGMEKVDSGVGTKFKIKKLSNGSGIGWFPSYE
eukprot:s1279_g18.t1